jgi:2-oxoisovalerate dehydrogenase E1 component alpha subunit
VSGADATAFQIIDPDGRFNEEAGADIDLKDEQLLDLFRLMSLVRRADAEATALQRQGELAVYPPLLGQEAAQVGATYALERTDFVFPSYRELGAAFVKGVDLVEYLHFYRGTVHGGAYDAYEHGFGMVCVPVASQIPHAVGYALGAKLDGKPLVAMPFFGDGATSQGDFHEGCNFAAVFRAPVVFFCQNNRWAISVPLSQQTVAPIWKKAEAYGFPGILVDGNDVLAVYHVTRQAVDRARAEGIPTLIEAATYRIGPHSTADDAGRYQPSEELERWKQLDPIARYRQFLTERGLLDDAILAEVEEEAARVASHIRNGIVGAPPPPLEAMFRWVYSEMPPELIRQHKQLREDAGLDVDSA